MPTDATDGGLVDASSAHLSVESRNLLLYDTSYGMSESFSISNPLDALAWMESISGIDERVNYPASFILSISMSGMEDNGAIRQIVNNMIVQAENEFGSRIIEEGRNLTRTAPASERALARGWINNAQSLSVDYAYAPSAVAISPIPETNAVVLAGVSSLIMFRRRRQKA